MICRRREPRYMRSVSRKKLDLEPRAFHPIKCSDPSCEFKRVAEEIPYMSVFCGGLALPGARPVNFVCLRSAPAEVGTWPKR